jgi:acyl carrier protein
VKPKWDQQFDGILRSHLTLLPAGAELSDDARLGSLGLDSLASIQLLVELEEAYAVSFPDERLTADTFSSPGALWAAVSSLAKRAADVRAGVE